MKEVFIYMFPGMVYFWISFIAQDPVQEVLHEKEAHLLERLLAAPVTVSQFLCSKMIRSFVLAGLIQSLLFVVSAYLFEISWGNPFLLTLVVLASALSATGVLSIIYAVAKTKEQASTLTYLVVIVCAFVGGSFIPFDDLPGFLQVIGQFTPNRWGVLATHTVVYAKPLIELVKPLCVLGAIGLCGCVVSFALFRRQLTKGGAA